MPAEEIPELEERLGWIILSAFELSNSKHLRQQLSGFKPMNKTNNLFKVQVRELNIIAIIHLRRQNSKHFYRWL